MDSNFLNNNLQYQQYPVYSYSYPSLDPTVAKVIEQLLKRISDLEARLDEK
jgi:hypothetical protein